MKKSISTKMTIGEILKRNPNALKTLKRFGLSCAECHLNTLETLEEGAKAHGLSEKEIQSILADLLSKA